METDKYYLTAIEIIRSGETPTLESVLCSKYPASDFSSNVISSALKAIMEAKNDAYRMACKTHPKWHYAVCAGASPSECFRLWKAEGGSEYLKMI